MSGDLVKEVRDKPQHLEIERGQEIANVEDDPSLLRGILDLWAFEKGTVQAMGEHGFRQVTEELLEQATDICRVSIGWNAATILKITL